MAEQAHIAIALDAMGGDNAPDSVLKGASIARTRHPDIHFIFYGDEALIAPKLTKLRKLRKNSTVIHTESAISNDEKPSTALRQGRDSSMGLCIKAVQDNKAQGCVSAGNTGPLMAMSKFMLRTLEGIDRPAIASLFPTIKNECVILDLGANVDCAANHLFQFAVMGDAFARAVLGLSNPEIGLLNIGSEEVKGNDTVKNASAMIRDTALPLNFYGHIEGDDIGKGTVDVVVTDGFSGNIALKTAEGTARMCAYYLRDAFRSSWLARLGYLLAKPAMNTLFHKLDPRHHNGAMFLGLNGIVVKSHGGADAMSFANAIGVAAELIKHSINDQITKEIRTSQELISNHEAKDA